jgi:lipase chaperone LimK
VARNSLARFERAKAHEQALELWQHYCSYLSRAAALRMASRHARTLRTFDRRVAKALSAIVSENAEQ